MSFGTWVVEKNSLKWILEYSFIQNKHSRHWDYSKAKLLKFRKDFLLTNKQTRFVICTLMWKEVGALDFI